MPGPDFYHDRMSVAFFAYSKFARQQTLTDTHTHSHRLSDARRLHEVKPGSHIYTIESHRTHTQSSDDQVIRLITHMTIPRAVMHQHTKVDKQASRSHRTYLPSAR